MYKFVVSILDEDKVKNFNKCITKFKTVNECVKQVLNVAFSDSSSEEGNVQGIQLPQQLGNVQDPLLLLSYAILQKAGKK